MFGQKRTSAFARSRHKCNEFPFVQFLPHIVRKWMYMLMLVCVWRSATGWQMASLCVCARLRSNCQITRHTQTCEQSVSVLESRLAATVSRRSAPATNRHWAKRTKRLRLAETAAHIEWQQQQQQQHRSLRYIYDGDTTRAHTYVMRFQYLMRRALVRIRPSAYARQIANNNSIYLCAQHRKVDWIRSEYKKRAV